MRWLNYLEGYEIKNGMKTSDIEISVAKYFDYRRNVIVPNVSWGLGLRYEADLVVLRKSGFAIEIEIKTSASDIKADLKKGSSAHCSNLFRELWFAVPDNLAQNQNIPEKAGILAIGNEIKIVRPARRNSNAQCWDNKRRNKLLELGLMRIWKLKEKLAATTQK